MIAYNTIGGFCEGLSKASPYHLLVRQCVFMFFPFDKKANHLSAHDNKPKCDRIAQFSLMKSVIDCVWRTEVKWILL